MQLPDLGPHVLWITPDTPAADLQARIHGLFAAQETAQFGPGRHALLALPGTYALDVPLGFHTQLVGLGRLPSDVVFQGGPTSTPWLKNHNATCNFWRAFENLSVEDAGRPLLWAVSQGCAVRRAHLRGDLALSLEGGWSSGGFLADTVVEGTVASGTQQQWLTRHSRLGAWTGANWNMVFVATEGAPSGSSWPDPPHTVVEGGGPLREKPFLWWHPTGGLTLRLPAFGPRDPGPSWPEDRGTDLPLAAFHVAFPGRDTAETLNRALAAGQHLLFTPGIYDLEGPVRVDRPDAVLFGLGYATLRPVAGTPALQVADVGGVVVAGLMVEAGPRTSPVLVEVGPPGSQADHRARPTTLHDLYLRIGGPHPGRAETALALHSSHVVADHLWLWRADHGEGVSWDENPCAHGLVVTGAGVHIYGLFAEHFQKQQVVWAGPGGRVWFYQCEIPYDVARQELWMDGDREGFAAYEVAPGVTDHEAWGLGIYCYFRDNPAVRLGEAVRAPEAPGVQFHRLTTVSLGGHGEISAILPGRGPAAKAGSPVARLKEGGDRR